MKKPKSSAIIVGLMLGFALTLCMATTFNYTLDTTRPQGTEAPSVLDDQIRNSKQAWQERLNVDHLMALTGSQVSDADSGYHRQVTFYSSTATDPILGVTAVSSVDELRYTDSEGSVLYLTSAGTLNIGSSDLLGTLANNVYFTAVDNAGTGVVDLIKADANDVAVLPDNSQTATNAAPTSSTGIANKKYVDDDHPTYSGGESHTDGSGTIMKAGIVAYSSSPQTITFAAAFPNAIVGAGCTSRVASGDCVHPNIVSSSTTTLVVRRGASTGTNPSHWYWYAMGW